MQLVARRKCDRSLGRPRAVVVSARRALAGGSGYIGSSASQARDAAAVDESTIDDRQLVNAAQNGDQAAFRELYRRYHRKVYSIALAMVRNHEEAMDILQDSFVKVHRYLDRFEHNSSFYTWLYRLVKNQCIDHLRKNKRHRAAAYDEKIGEQSSLGPKTERARLELSNPNDPRSEVQRREIRAAVEACLGELSEKHRTVIVLREIQGLSYEEMAQACECSKGTIMSRLFHARRKMQAALKQRLGTVVQDNTGEDAKVESDPQAPSADASEALLS